MSKNNRTRKLDSAKRSLLANPASRSGSNAGRGFRFQDAVSVWLAVEIWAGRRPSALLIPEGGDDIELRGEESSFVQVKSRREHLGNYPEGETAGHVADLWKRSLTSFTPPDRLMLILERDVEGLNELKAAPAHRRSPLGSIHAKLSGFQEAFELFSATSIIVASSPQEWAITIISDHIECAPIAAQLCFAEILGLVGGLADENGRLNPENYRGLSISDTETTIRNVLAAIDPAAIERALREGVCEPVDFLTPLNDPSFYLGIDVEPGHIAAGLVSERPHSRSALIQGIEDRRAALIVGPSGAGKSALMWDAANILRHTVRWFRIRRLDMKDIPSLRQLIRTFRASEASPLGFVMDDIGRNGPESWGALVKEAMSVPGVVLLGSVREEDITLIAERARAAEVNAEPDDELAERLWQQLYEAEKTDWAGWREPWSLSGGLLLEYVHILTRGRRMYEVLADQVAARTADPSRSLELDILRSGAWAGCANASVDASRLACALAVDEAALSRALQRLIQEHLVFSPTPGAFAGLHQLRSEELLKLSHQTVLPTLDTSFERTVTCVSATDLEALVAYALSGRRLPLSSVLKSLASALESKPDARSLASALRGLGAGRIFAGVNEWFETSEVRALTTAHIEVAATFGVAEMNLDALGVLKEIQAASNSLARIKGSPGEDPRRQLLESMASSTLSALIQTADMASLDEILKALVGMPLSEVIKTALRKIPTNLLSNDLELVGSVVGSLASLDREIAIQWVNSLGQNALFAKIQAETAWAGPVTTEIADDGQVVHCDFWYVAGSVQENPHDAVVSLCGLMLALCPSADIAESNAITASGALAGLAQLPLATKRIPRKNLPHSSIPQWNRRWIELISRHVAAPNYSNYLARSISILEELVPILDKVFDVHFRGKKAPAQLFESLSSIHAKTQELTPPAVTPLKATARGDGDTNDAVSASKLHGLLNNTSTPLINRFLELPVQAGSYIGWLNTQIADIDTAIAEEPWQLISNNPPAALHRLKALLEALRLLAGESHERQKPPLHTWIKVGKRAQRGNAVRLISVAAKTSAEARQAHRKLQIEHAAKTAGIETIFHLRSSPKGILPWPPVDTLALLPVTSIFDAVVTLEEHSNSLRSLVDSTTRLTIMPYVNRVAIPALSRSGYSTLLPDIDSALVWAESLKLTYSTSAIATLFGDVLSLANELRAMEQIGLGTGTRPEQEVIARQSLEASLSTKYNDLISRLELFDSSLQTEVEELVEYLRTADIDFIAEAQAAIDGSPSETLATTSYLSLLLVESELNRIPRD